MYKSHIDDPLTFQDGGQLLYRVGDYMNSTRCTLRDAKRSTQGQGSTRVVQPSRRMSLATCGRMYGQKPVAIDIVFQSAWLSVLLPL